MGNHITDSKGAVTIKSGWIDFVRAMKYECESCGKIVHIMKDNLYEAPDGAPCCADCYVLILEQKLEKMR